MTSFATHYDGNKRVRQVSVVLKGHGEKLFPNDRRLEKVEDRKNPGWDDPVIVTIFLCYPAMLSVISLLSIYLCISPSLLIIIDPCTTSGYSVHIVSVTRHV